MNSEMPTNTPAPLYPRCYDCGAEGRVRLVQADYEGVFAGQPFILPAAARYRCEVCGGETFTREQANAVLEAGKQALARATSNA